MKEMTKNLNSELKTVTDWLSVNKLKLNIKKTKCMLINNKDKTIDFEIIINGVKIENVQSFKYLGVIIDNKLSLNENVLNVCKKVAKKILAEYRNI